jgi:uncharacterized protein YbjT (DUF2867 family)
MQNRSHPAGRRAGTVLVAGASGRLGRHLVRELARRGWRIRALTRDPARLRGLVEPPHEVVAGSILEPASLSTACEGADVVLSAAGGSLALDLSDRRPTYMEVDFAGNANLLEQARAAGVVRFVYVSLHGARQLIRTEYAAAHERFVAALAASGVPYTVVRPTGFFGVFGEFLSMAARGRALLVGDGSTHTNPIDERDLAPICADAIDADEREIAVGGPKVYTRRRIAELAFEAVGRPPRILSIPPWALATAGATVRPISPRLHALIAFGLAASELDLVAPPHGTRTLPAYFAELASARGLAAPPRLVRSA